VDDELDSLGGSGADLKEAAGWKSRRRPARPQRGAVRGQRQATMSPPRPPLNAENILATLYHQGVRYVVIGAFAAITRGAPN